VFVGEQEVADGRYGLKNLETGDQVLLDEQSIVSRLGERDG
jgi:hypothetical protein